VLACWCSTPLLVLRPVTVERDKLGWLQQASSAPACWALAAGRVDVVERGQQCFEPGEGGWLTLESGPNATAQMILYCLVGWLM
jgi:hypothetical protein